MPPEESALIPAGREGRSTCRRLAKTAAGRHRLPERYGRGVEVVTELILIGWALGCSHPTHPAHTSLYFVPAPQVREIDSLLSGFWAAARVGDSSRMRALSDGEYAIEWAQWAVKLQPLYFHRVGSPGPVINASYMSRSQDVARIQVRIPVPPCSAVDSVARTENVEGTLVKRNGTWLLGGFGYPVCPE